MIAECDSWRATQPALGAGGPQVLGLGGLTAGSGDGCGTSEFKQASTSPAARVRPLGASRTTDFVPNIRYHATTKALAVGRILRAKPRPVTHRVEVENALGQGRPSNVISRTQCFFTTEKPYEASTYISAEPSSSSWQLYRVTTEHEEGHPMSLVDMVRVAIEKGHDPTPIVAEYWIPTKKWLFVEYLATEVTVDGLEPAPDSVSEKAALPALMSDRQSALILWPYLK